MLKKSIISICIGLCIVISVYNFSPLSILPEFSTSFNSHYEIGEAIVLASEEMQGGHTPVATAALVKTAGSFSSNNIGNISVDFKDADIQSVLRVLAVKGNVNIVAANDVIGAVTVKLNDVPWEKALDVILKTYDYSYERQGNIITVTTIDRLTAQKEAEKKLFDIQPIVSEVFTLKYLDADDLKDTLQPQLSQRGNITVLKMTSEAGWQFSGGAKGESLKKLTRGEKSKTTRSKTLIVSDVSSNLERIKAVIKILDVPPQQVLIQARIIEVNEDVLRDIGFDWGTGSGGADSSTISTTDINKNSSGNATQTAGGH